MWAFPVQNRRVRRGDLPTDRWRTPSRRFDFRDRRHRRRPRRFRATSGREHDEDLHRTEWFVIQPPRTKNLYEAHFLKETHMASKTKTSDPEENKAIALRLAEVFNGRRLDLLEDGSAAITRKS